MDIIRPRSNSMTICISGNSWSSPTDSTQVFLGNIGVIASTYGQTLTSIPIGGRVTAVYIHQSVSGVLGSSETSTINFRLNDTTNTAITAVFQQDQQLETFSNTALDIAIAAGDTFALEWATPAWVTNPTVVFWTATIQLDS